MPAYNWWNEACHGVGRNGRATGELFTLQQGQLQASNTDDLWLSEGFAERDGWLVRDERISWADWLKRQAA